MGARALVAPAMLLAAVAVESVMNQLGAIGPFDRAKVGWAVEVPLVLLSPLAAGLAARSGARPVAGALVVSIATVIGVVTVAWLAAATTFLDCRPVTSPLQVIPRALPLGVVAGAGFAFVAWVAWRAGSSRGIAVAVVTGALAGIGWLAALLLTWAASFPGISCAAPR